jgi:hypothetical protein
MSIEYIDTLAQFDSKIGSFKDRSKISTNPVMYHIGLDCEYITKNGFPESFKNSSSPTGWVIQSSHDISVCTLQIANDKECLVINLTKFNKVLPNSLMEILRSGNWIKTGVGIDLDMMYISDNFQLGCNGHIDIRTHAILSGIVSPSLQNLSGVEKPHTFSQRDWSQEMTLANLKYAGSDGFQSHKLGKQLLSVSKNAFKHLNIVPGLNSGSILLKTTYDVTNFIGILQEYVISHSNNKSLIDYPKYTDYQVDGSSHLFVVECRFKQLVGHGTGPNKMTAKQNSAKEVYRKLLDQNK